MTPTMLCSIVVAAGLGQMGVEETLARIAMTEAHFERVYAVSVSRPIRVTAAGDLAAQDDTGGITEYFTDGNRQRMHVVYADGDCQMSERRLNSDEEITPQFYLYRPVAVWQLAKANHPVEVESIDADRLLVKFYRTEDSGTQFIYEDVRGVLRMLEHRGFSEAPPERSSFSPTIYTYSYDEEATSTLELIRPVRIVQRADVHDVHMQMDIVLLDFEPTLGADQFMPTTAALLNDYPELAHAHTHARSPN